MDKVISPPVTQQVQACLQGGQGRAAPGGRFEVDAISAGEGNGWQFSAEVLEESLPLWEGASCYVDHSWPWNGHSVRDLAGVFHRPRWEAAAQAVRLDLETIGPAGALVAELGQALLEEPEPRPPVGFSADLLFTAQGRRVLKILKINSLDVVVNPARGGAFVRTIQSQPFNHGGKMETQPKHETEVQAQLQSMSAYLLESALNASALPAAAQDDLRRRFSGRTFEPDELKNEIEHSRKLTSALMGGSVVAGGGRISEMTSVEDRLQAAVDDLLGAPRDKNAGRVEAQRLSGIRELYHLTTGDWDFHGGYYPDRVQLATTADFTGLVKNALNKIVANQWEALGRAGYTWWEKVVTVEHFSSLNSITGTLIGTVGSLPTVAEGAAYTELKVGDSPETASFTKYGGYIPLTLELIDRDETRKLRAYPRELANAGLRKISQLVAEIFTAGGGVGPQLADGGALFNANPANQAGGHANLGTDALSAAAWDAACGAVFAQPMLIKNEVGLYGTGPKMALHPRYLLVPRALQLTAKKILYPGFENAVNIVSENQQQGAPGDVVTVPEWSDANNWAAACDPLLAPAIFIGERFGLLPEVFIAGEETSPAVFMNDEHRLKVRHFLAAWVNDYRPLYKGNVV